MQYDPIKKVLGNFFNRTPAMRKVFYRMLDWLLLRTWHVKKELREWKKDKGDDVQILDAGSGFGQYDYALIRMNPKWTIEGIDVKEEQVEDCNQFFKKIGYPNVYFHVDDLTTYYKDNHFDLVLSVDVMEHILEDVEVFKNFYRSMKPGGMVLISTPSDQGGSDVHEHDDESFIEEHVRDGYNIEAIQEKLKTAGFQKTEARYSYGKPGQISWRLSMKYPIKLLNVSKLFFILIPFYYLLAFPIACCLNYRDVNKQHPSGTGLIVKAWKTE
ncbi:MAG: methyltransferase domain-containing protein [Bacteroidales bacterium]|nr:methyltransferase domain-containing protein [Bacteroidales bacterium]MCF8328235.1 methyltransferase domain-containing protein [Bacteroidales bacterium]